MDSSISDIAKDPLAKPFFNMVTSIVGIAGAAVYYLHSSITSGDEETRNQLDSRIGKLETEMKSNSDKLMRELALIRSDLVNDRQTAALERQAFSLDRQTLKNELMTSGNKRASGEGSAP